MFQDGDRESYLLETDGANRVFVRGGGGTTAAAISPRGCMDVGGAGGGSRYRGGRGAAANPNPGAADGGRPDSQAEETIRSPPCPDGIHGCAACRDEVQEV